MLKEQGRIRKKHTVNWRQPGAIMSQIGWCSSSWFFRMIKTVNVNVTLNGALCSDISFHTLQFSFVI